MGLVLSGWILVFPLRRKSALRSMVEVWLVAQYLPTQENKFRA
jgi:hypothetical protein